MKQPLSAITYFFVMALCNATFAHEKCPVMEDAYFSLSRVALNLTQTRFGTTAEILASQILVRAAIQDISAAMDQRDCVRNDVNPLPNFNMGSYRGNCPVVESAKNYSKRALQDFPRVREVFKPAVVHPQGLTNNILNLLNILGKQQGCK